MWQRSSVPILLAAISAAAYGVGDFFGGLSARRMPATAAAVTAQVTGLILLLGLCVVVAGTPALSDIAWGAAAGTSGGLALTAFYWALVTGQMNLRVSRSCPC